LGVNVLRSPSILTRRVPEAVDQAGQSWHPGPGERSQMHLAVQLDTRRQVGRLVESLHEVADCRDLLGGHVPHAFAQGERFDPLADLVDLNALRELEERHAGPLRGRIMTSPSVRRLQDMPLLGLRCSWDPLNRLGE
jgi:hypothetical protein